MKKVYLTSTLGCYEKIDGIRVSSVIDNTNMMLDKLLNICNEDSFILLVASNPLSYDKNDEMLDIMRKSFIMSGLKYKNMIYLDGRNENKIDSILSNADIVILMGGHLPTQNEWFNKINMKDRLNIFNGCIIGQSAGSMNLASTVYACPEYEEELDEVLFPRFIDGIGLTDINIFPHYDKYKDMLLGSFKMLDDIVINDSYKCVIYALNDGSYIEICNDYVSVYGECFKIENGRLDKICSNGQVIELR